MSESKPGKRVVIKIGTGVLTRGSSGEIHHAMLARLAQAMADLRNAGHELVVVSSGAVGAGLSTFGLEQRPEETELLQACADYPGASNARRITFEYVMLAGVNDSLADARELVRLLKGIPAKINLIPFNPWPGSAYTCSSWEQIEAFAEVVNRAGYASPVRTPRGRDILAACGQLKSESVKTRASAARKTSEANA